MSNTPIMEHFSYEHLEPGHHRELSMAFCKLAERIDRELPGSAEKSAGLRKLLEGKDCVVRAALSAAKNVR